MGQRKKERKKETKTSENIYPDMPSYNFAP